ncbi:DDE-domain-containing protein [Choiromyces venosus 120613-1]|uniref:DDE-domain-containing protein n=1 Tax=Choiromyces venosus 120613-1 TaxID=1336337 RepID=A0A3N4K651_9PEZI|nr:DDE-domain-containing protein [Choiromyces venosus 120613-1]
MVLSHAVGRFEESNICNLDETPILFEYLEGKTYDTIGQKTIWAKAGQNGWDKRQASLVLCIFVDGILRVPSMIIFCGKGERLGREQSDYHPGVEVEFNEKAYMNDSLFLRYIEEQLVPVLGGRPTLFAIDLMGSHKTPAVLEKLQANNITPSLIPARCTSLIQPLDISVNKPFKEIMRELTDNAIFEAESLETFRKWSVSHRRILTTSCVGDAYYRFHIEKGDIIQQVFRKVGLSLPIDGSCDLELDIKGFSGIQIGNWQEDQGCVNEISTISDIHDNDESIEFVDSTELL